MRPGARTPEELETLLEDTFVIRDREALAQLFEEGGLLVAGDGRVEARGSEEIESRVATLWERRDTYLADPRRVLQARNTALVVGEGAMAVMRRGADRKWRYTIAVLSTTDGGKRKE